MSAEPPKRTPSLPILHHGLTTKQAAFARECHKNGGNASSAYRHAFDAEDMSPTCLSSTSSKLARRPAIKAYMADLEKQAAAAAQITRDMLLERLMRLHDLAVDKGDLAVATRVLELAGKALPQSVWAGDRKDEKRLTADQLAKAVVDGHDKLMKGIARSKGVDAKHKLH